MSPLTDAKSAALRVFVRDFAFLNSSLHVARFLN